MQSEKWPHEAGCTSAMSASRGGVRVRLLSLEPEVQVETASCHERGFPVLNWNFIFNKVKLLS